MLPNPKELRKITETAIAKGKAAHEKELEAIREKEEHKQWKYALLAAQILDQVPGKCETEAGHGRTHAVVMSLDMFRDYSSEHNKGRGGSHDRLPAEYLLGPGKIVWDALVNAGLEPTIESWHDGIGMNAGFNIVVKW